MPAMAASQMIRKISWGRFWNRDHQSEMVYGYHLHSCTERRVNLSGICYGPVQPQDHRVCLWNVNDSGTGSGGCKECVPECQGYRGDYPLQRPWKPVYKPGV